MTTVFDVQYFSFLQCFNVVGWGTGRLDRHPACLCYVLLQQFSQVTNFPCHAAVSAHTDIRNFLLLAQPSGTHCPKTLGIRNVLWTLTDSRWRHSCSCST